MDENYWTTEWGVRPCNPCLLANADDFPQLEGDERIFALRLLYSDPPHPWGQINWVSLSDEIGRASDKIIPDQIEFLRQLQKRAITLYKNGRFLEAMEAARTLFGLVNGLRESVMNRNAVKTGRKVRRASEVANRNRQASASSARSKWQLLADDIWAQPQHASKSKRAVALLIAKRTGENEDTIRRAIARK